MTQYNWVDNPTASGVADYNPDVLNDCLMSLKYNVPASFDTKLTSYSKKDLSNSVPAQAFKNASISWRMPDYTAAVNITSSKKAPSDGLCCYQGSCNAGQYITALVNGNSVGRIAGTQLTGNTATLLFSVSKNDVISSQASYNIISEELIFYPFKGAT